MTVLAFLLVLTAAFGHASWNLLAKKAGGGVPFIWIYSTVSAIICAPLALAVVFHATALLRWLGDNFRSVR